MFKLEEIRDLGISIILLGLMFGFDDGAKTFILKDWLINLLKIIFLVAISILIREGVIKLVALSKNVESIYQIWNINRIWFGGYGKIKKGIPMGIILAILFIFISKGKFFFTAIGIHELKEKLVARTGNKKIFLEYFEEALIVLSGVITHVLLVVIAILISKSLGINLVNFTKINFYMALFSLLPLSNLDGSKIFFGSIILWLFTLIFVIISFLFLKYGLLLEIIIAFIVAFIGILIYYIKYES